MIARPNYMPPEQFDKVIAAIPLLHIRKWKDEDVQMLFKIAYWIALRFDEVYKRKAEDFDLKNRIVYLGKTKANSNDDAAIPVNFIPELSLYLIDKKGELFPGITYGTAIVWIKRLGKMLDIPAWTTPQSETGEKTLTHIFRKSIAKDMYLGTYGKKASLPVVSKTLRHKGKDPLATTFHYLKVDSEEVKDWWNDTTPRQET